jgi:pyruvate dehydrogenase E2 component (dihydrolipoamide acetyltransferase)
VNELLMPALADGMEDGTLAEWLVQDAAEVVAGQELVEIETDKATVAWPSPGDGTLQILVQAGETVAVGTPIGALLDPGEAPMTDGRHHASTAVAVPVAGALARVVEPAVRANPTAGRRKASPLARRIAASHRLELAEIVGSGPDGRIVKRDVEALLAAESPVRPVAPSADGDAGPQFPTAQGAGPRGDVSPRPLSRFEAIAARRLSTAKTDIPEFAVSTLVDMDAAMAFRDQLRDAVERAPSVNDLIIKAAALALRRHPDVNASFQGDRVDRYSRVNVGIAVATPQGLLVPTLFDADRKGLAQIAADARRVATAARDGRSTPAELDGGTFTVSNLGMFGVTHFEAIINPPQVAILAVGAVVREPIVRAEVVVPGHRMEMTMVSDHRALSGAPAGEFLAEVRRMLEHPALLAL